MIAISLPGRCFFMTLWNLIWISRRIAAAPAALLAILAAVLLLAGTSDAPDWRMMILVAIGAAWPAVVAAALFAAARDWSLPRNIAFQLAVGCVAGVVVWFPAETGLFHPTYFVGLAFASLAAPLSRLRSAENYWPWVEKLCFAAALAALGALVGFLAIVATLLSAATLFGLAGLTFDAIATRLAIFMFVAVMPIVFLALEPPIVETTLDERATDFLRRAGAALACYALAPFVLVYSALLWAYAGKIALEGALPMGQVGLMVGAFGFSAMLTVLLIFPERHRGPFVVRWLWRIWPFLLPAPLVLLGFAIAERVSTYGLTPDRYVAILLTLLCAASGLAALGARDRVIRFAPAATALALLAASFGPFGAVAVSLRWQNGNLSAILAAHGLLRPDGRLLEEGPPVALTAAETRKWRAATELIRQNDRAPALFGPESPKTADALQRLEARIVFAKLADVSDGRPARWRSLYTQSWAAPSDGALDAVAILGSITLPIIRRGGDDDATPDPLHAALDGLRLSVEPPGEAAASFDLSDLAQRLDARAAPLARPVVVESTSAGTGGLLLLVDQFDLRADDEGVQITSLTALVLKRAAPAPASAHSR
jgi:hypothetical protein